MNVETSTALNVDAIRSKLKNVQRREALDDTAAFAFEDDAGNLVKVYVAKDKAAAFKDALGALLDQAEREGLEIAEVIYRLHQGFDIVNVEWSEGAIPEEEEEIENNEDAEAQGFPQTDPESDEEVTADLEIDDLDATSGDGEQLTAIDDPSITNNVKLMNQLMSLLTAKTEAEKAKADAEKAQAEVEASKVAAQAAAQYAANQEELMDMDNYNKLRQEEKREALLQAKLLRYRHDLRKDDQTTVSDRVNDPANLLNMINKASIGNPLGESMNQNYLSTEEEELLAAEDWEQEERERRNEEKKREKLMRFRHAQKKKQRETTTEGNDGLADDTSVSTAAVPGGKRPFLDFLKAQGFEYGADHEQAQK